jgi:hypothetical protein
VRATGGLRGAQKQPAPLPQFQRPIIIGWMHSFRSPWWTWLPSGFLLLMFFAIWDDGATSLFVGAIVPVHVAAAASIWQFCPADHRSIAICLARLSLLVPIVVASV